ncbi:hypothetical protein GW17_00041134 [Ensete ventricosum]|nr:hypothetical protein GW17_00041134 [Ensete ventricosum]RZR96129.1 hypothetical protein BHM03_00025097 [Ensete ventricosum]
MRLNRVELFYALVAAIGNESRRCLRGRGDHMQAVCMQRWLAMTRPLAGATGHGLATCKGRPAMAWLPARGGRLRPSPLYGAIARRGGSPQGPVGSGQLGGVVAHGQPYRQQGQRCRSQGWPPLSRVAADRKGQPPLAQG